MSNPNNLPIPGGSKERFYPIDCVVASVASEDEAAAIAFELRKAGFSNDTCQIISGANVVARHQAVANHRSIDERFAPKPVGDEHDIEEAYLAAARDGAHLAIVRAPSVELRGRVRRILIEHGAHHIRFYQQAGIEEL